MLLKQCNCFLGCRCIKGEPAIEEYYEWYLEAEMYSNQITKTVVQSSAAQAFLLPGRLVVVKSESVTFSSSSFYFILMIFFDIFIELNW